jgi:hypothetical protein
MKTLKWAAGLMAVTLTSQAATPEWLFKEFVNSWNTPGQGLEEFLNIECRPAGLDGIQTLAVQKGHNSAYNVHVYCRRDGSAAARYRVTMTTFSFGQVDDAARTLLVNANVRIGPFYFGKDGEPDGFLLIEKIH